MVVDMDTSGELPTIRRALEAMNDIPAPAVTGQFDKPAVGSNSAKPNPIKPNPVVGMPVSRAAAPKPIERHTAKPVEAQPEAEVIVRSNEAPDPTLDSQLISPFAVRFSQARISPEFVDGRSIDETIQNITVKVISHGSRKVYGLQTPFPPIQIMKFRAKRRDVAGRPLLDVSGNDRYFPEKWYSLDNRRLYCMQKVAASLWPLPVVGRVYIRDQLPPSKFDGNQAAARALKKFKSCSDGRSVTVGVKSAAEQKRWVWLEAARANAGGCVEPFISEGVEFVRQKCKFRFISKFLDNLVDSSQCLTSKFGLYQVKEEEDIQLPPCSKNLNALFAAEPDADSDVE